MAKATNDFPQDIGFKDAARRVLLAQFDKMMDNAAGTRAGEDIEALHDMRVGSRRLRAALSVFAKAFPKSDYQMLDKQIGDITDALGAVRDLDVQLDYLRGVRDPLPPNEAYGLTRLIERQNKRRDKERKKLVKALDRLQKDKFAQRFMKVLDKAVPVAAARADKGGELTVAKGAPIHKLTQPNAPLRDSAPVILVRLQEMFDWAPAMRDPENVEELHNMRIAAKRLRYTMELFTPCFGDDFQRSLKTVEAIQERIGAIHDCDVLLPLLSRTLDKETEREKKKALRKGGSPPLFVAAEGLAPLIARKETERERLYHEFVAFWDALPPERLFAAIQQSVQPEPTAAE